MKRAVYILLGAQFLTAFADNAILFTAFAMITQAGGYADWYKAALQASFLVAFVVLAPWVGRLADEHAKGRVLTLGNALKAGGALLLLLGVDPLLAYGVVGVGAAVYGPAKYGILPDLVSHEHLVKANGWIEGSTVVAILLGAVVGAHVADRSIGWALTLVAAAYLLSLIATLFIPPTATAARDPRPALVQFVRMMSGFFATSRARFSMLGAAIFWATAVVLRVMLVAWAPAVLLTTSTAQIAGSTFAREIKDTSTHAKFGRSENRPGSRFRAFSWSSTTTRPSVRIRSWSCARPTSTAYTFAAPRWSRQSVKPPVEAPASRQRRPAGDRAKASRAEASLPPARLT